MAVKKNYISKNTEYTVNYSGMRGVDFSREDGKSKRYRFSYLENMYKDYSNGGEGIIESIPGFRKIASLGGKVNSIFSHTDQDGKPYIVVHAGKNLYRFETEKRDSLAPLQPIASLSDGKSSGFRHSNDLYIIDGTSFTVVKGDGSVSKVGDGESASPYVPTTYYNGEEYEQRNLLTERFCERYVISAASDHALETEGLTYKILSNEAATAAVTGIASNASGTVYVPSYTYIAGEKYKVTEICGGAFRLNTKITSVILSDSVSGIGESAFESCTALTTFISRYALEHIGKNAFKNCTSISKVHLGIGLSEIEENAFSGCSSLKSVDYEGTDAQLGNAAVSLPDGITVNYSCEYKTLVIEIPIYSPAKSLEKVTLDGKEFSYSTKIVDSLFAAIIITTDDRDSLDGKELMVTGKTHEARFTKNTVGTNFISEEGAAISGKDAILGCTVCASFDGRIFLSGNKKLPNTVFYSSRDNTGRNNPLYFGILNYFNDGTGGFSVKSLLATGDSLAVFKSGDDGGGSVYYHTPKETGVNILPKIYPVSYIHSGISAIGGSVSFFDDPLFLSSLGCTALDKREINLERSIVTRSENVNAKLLCEDLEKSSLTIWLGYLVIQVGEHIYLADSRDLFTNSQGKTEYEWYYLSGIGTHVGSVRVYRYAEYAKNGYSAHPTKTDCEVSGEIYLALGENNEAVYYTIENGIKYEVYTDGERRGGSFSPASYAYSTEDDLLFFGTESGDLCVFNSDKRGIAPFFIEDQSDFSEEEYKKIYGSRIHPYFYNFDFHAPRYALRTISDNCGIPHFTKNTVKNSLVVKLRCLGNGNVTCEAGTEGAGYKEIAELPDASLNFSEFNFSDLSFENNEYVTLSLKEREKGWIEKNISFYSEKYSSPFGIYSITYRFSIKGKIKH